MEEQNLKAMNPRKHFEGVGGSYNKWYPSDYPLLAQSKVGAGMLLLHPRGFAILHYSDASKVGYVLRGNNGVTGFIFPNTSNEEVIKLKKGDIIPVPTGVTSWWYNDGDSDLEIAFLGETKYAHVPGDISYYILSGPQGILQGFSQDYVAKTFNLNEMDTSTLLNSQQNGMIFKLQEGQTLPTPTKDTKFVYNLDNYDFFMKVSESEFPFIGETGLAVVVERLGPNVVRSPVLLVSPADQLIYVARGSGTVQIVGLSSSSKIELHVESGQLIFVPKYFAAGKIAAEQGMEFFSILTAKLGLVGELKGKTSVMEALSAEVIAVSFNITAEFEKVLRSNTTN
uniref:Cupin type-1 domain-containing protein n=1 Tax=Cucumis sativus TaxID=3659 RepID=A0A0A0K550_CUCSA